MNIMIAYDDSRNARLAVEHTVALFGALKPTITLICVVEEPGSTAPNTDDMYSAEYLEKKASVEKAAEKLAESNLAAKVLIAQGDPRKMILRATLERKPDLLVIARHSTISEGGFIARAIDAMVDEFDHMTFGATSAFLTRRATCPILILPAP